jgi:hypothetical protein
LQGAIAELISHGLIYRTRSHGANGAWARYAVTWLSIKEKTDLFLGGFVSCAWRNWEPTEKKAPPRKCRTPPAKTAVSPSDFPQIVQESTPQKLQTMNVIPCGGLESAPQRRANEPKQHLSSPLSIELSVVTDSDHPLYEPNPHSELPSEASNKVHEGFRGLACHEPDRQAQ